MKSKKYMIIISLILIIAIAVFAVVYILKKDNNETLLEDEISWEEEISIDPQNEEVIKQIMDIDNIDISNIVTRTAVVEDYDNTVRYKVSNNVTQLDTDFYSYGDNIYILVTIGEAGEATDYFKEFSVNGKKFLISTVDNFVGIFSEIENNLYYIIGITFDEESELTQDALENIKPFLDIEID